MSAEITLIKKGGANPLMSKRIFLDEQGVLRSDASQCLMVQGTATRAAAETASDLAKHIASCDYDQALALGALKAGLPNSVTITTERKLKESPGAIARSRDFIDYRPGECGWALIDYDTKGMPPAVAATIEAAGGMLNALLNVAPGLRLAARVSRATPVRGSIASTPASIMKALGPTTTCWSRTGATSSALCAICMTVAGSTVWAGT